MGVLLLNDTDEGGAHFGCQRVMRTIRDELELRGLRDLPSLKVGTDWKSDTAAQRLIDGAALVVINGEGTLHHGRRKGRWLLEAGARVKANGGKVALINALWQDNPDDWADLAAPFDLLWCRDSRSAEGLGRQAKRPVAMIGDLSMFHAAKAAPQPRTGVIVSCSVHHHVTEQLAKFAQITDSRFLPVTTSIVHVDATRRGIKAAWRRFMARRFANSFQAKYPQVQFAADDDEYIQEISGASLLVTGRFHAACLAILTRTPFVAVASNSWKIEMLIRDVGLDEQRLQPLGALTPELAERRDWSYSSAELDAIGSALTRWRAEGKGLFDHIASLSH